MKIERALEIVKAKNRPVFVPMQGPHPDTATLWNVEPGQTIQEAVYFAYSGGLVKIGYSTFARNRQGDLSAAGAHPVTMVLLVPGNEAAERKFHDRFAADREHHEWFRLSKKMRDFFKARLCPIGRASLREAEARFWEYIQSTHSDISQTQRYSRGATDKIAGVQAKRIQHRFRTAG